MSVHFSFGQTDEIEVELASVWRRLAAFVINLLLFCVFLAVGWKLSYALIMSLGWLGSLALGGFSILSFFVIQWRSLAKTGQSLGKRIMGIRVIRADGEWANSMRTVWLREIGFFIFMKLLGYVLFYFLMGNNILTRSDVLALNQMILPFLPEKISFWNRNGWQDEMWLMNYGLDMLVMLICVLMMCFQRDKRTLQDFLAGTIVIKL